MKTFESDAREILNKSIFFDCGGEICQDNILTPDEEKEIKILLKMINAFKNSKSLSKYEKSKQQNISYEKIFSMLGVINE